AKGVTKKLCIYYFFATLSHNMSLIRTAWRAHRRSSLLIIKGSGGKYEGYSPGILDFTDQEKVQQE
ncbi:hypothetical protein, partial [Escherichia coli]|uniref:hypothetical protein n=1 Tax=Escherichia coli TaxID=562 RepID=UPI001BB18FF9